MRIKFVKTADITELEATSNMLFMEGWVRNSGLFVLANGEFLLEFINYDRRQPPQNWEPYPERVTTAQPQVCRPEPGSAYTR